ncbi:MAG: DUF4365 domain-containing protein [Candidatus Gastranaerophilales bacterium]|nr:DUF4365 domain-containing protein [Candidatus Gastranaerophilales bacterium]
MTQITQKTIIDKSGINKLRSLVENKGSIFREINKQDDIGFDANIEFCKMANCKYLPSGIEIKIQVKSGESYFNKIGSFIKGDREHFAYWKNFNLPAFGITYNPKTETLYWVNITEFLLNNHTKGYNIPVNNKNILNKDTFDYFMQYCIDYCIKDKNRFSITKKLNDLYDTDTDTELSLGSLSSLFLSERNENFFWNIILNYLYFCNDKNVLYHIVYYLTIAMGEQVDVFWHENNIIKTSISIWLKNKFNEIVDEVILYKVLSVIGPNEGIDRGTIGNLIIIMIKQIQNRNFLLLDIFKNKKYEFYIRDIALMYYLSEIKPKDAIDFLNQQLNRINNEQLPLNIDLPLYKEFEDEFILYKSLIERDYGIFLF